MIGRDFDQCDVVLSHPTVSRRHARLVLADDILQIEDLGSTNGTAVDGECGSMPASRRPLQAGCMLKIGEINLPSERANDGHDGQPLEENDRVGNLRGVLPAGTTLRGYELKSILGQGAFGITYRARDLTLGRDVAIKEYLPTTLALREGRTTVLPRSADHAEQFAWGRERFLEEARTLARLDRTPAIVRVLRFPRGQRHRLHGDGAGRGRDPEQAPDARAAADAGGRRAAALPAARRAGGGPWHRLPASRHQARQHHGRRPRPADPDRLRRRARGHGRTLDDA